MGKQTIVTYTDDMTGKSMTADEINTVYVVTQQGTYELDISVATHKKHIQPLTDAGRKVATDKILAGRRPATPTVDKEQRKAVREWWQRNAGKKGLPAYSDRGRIPVMVDDAFQARTAVPSLPDASKPVAAPQFSSATPVAAAKMPAPRKAVTAKASRARRRTTKP